MPLFAIVAWHDAYLVMFLHLIDIDNIQSLAFRKWWLPWPNVQGSPIWLCCCVPLILWYPHSLDKSWCVPTIVSIIFAAFLCHQFIHSNTLLSTTLPLLFLHLILWTCVPSINVYQCMVVHFALHFPFGIQPNGLTSISSLWFQLHHVVQDMHLPRSTQAFRIPPIYQQDWSIFLSPAGNDWKHCHAASPSDSFAIIKMNHSEYLHVLQLHIFRSSVSLMLPSPSMISLMFIYSCCLHFWVATNSFSIIHNMIHHSFCILHMASISMYTSELGFFWVMTKSNFLHFITTLLT